AMEGNTRPTVMASRRRVLASMTCSMVGVDGHSAHAGSPASVQLMVRSLSAWGPALGALGPSDPAPYIDGDSTRKSGVDLIGRARQYLGTWLTKMRRSAWFFKL